MIIEYIQLQCIFAFILWVGIFEAAIVSLARPEDVQKLPGSKLLYLDCPNMVLIFFVVERTDGFRGDSSRNDDGICDVFASQAIFV